VLQYIRHKEETEERKGDYDHTDKRVTWYLNGKKQDENEIQVHEMKVKKSCRLQQNYEMRNLKVRQENHIYPLNMSTYLQKSNEINKKTDYRASKQVHS
jgi:hypothetical protein